MKRALLAASCVALSACSDPATANGTSLYLTLLFGESQFDLRQLFITGTVDEADVFPRSYRPDPAATEKLSSPQTLRALLVDGIADAEAPVNIFVAGVDVTQTPVAEARGTVKPVKGREVTLTLTLKTATSLQFDAGSEGDGGFGFDGGLFRDGGTRDAGGPGDGGAFDGGCQCPNGCCFPGETGCFAPLTRVVPLPDLPPYAFTVAARSSAGVGSFCDDVCDPQRTSFWNGACRCGAQSACGQGQRCAPLADNPNGTNPLRFSCVCDTFSTCNGCCEGTSCVPLLAVSSNRCGSGGFQCRGCPNNTPCTAAGKCQQLVACGLNQCGTSERCEQADFPTCTFAVTNTCQACDPVRANRCNATSTSNNHCFCGASPQCGPKQRCETRNNAFVCVGLFDP